MVGYSDFKKYDIVLKRILLLIFAVSIGVVLNLSGVPAIPIVSAADSDITYEKADSNELRGIWIPSVPTSNFSFPSRQGLSADEMKAELDGIIKTCKETNLNAIFFQVRPTGDALYDSSIFPTSKYLTGTQGAPFTDGFDPFKYIIEIAHANNIEVHAWINPYRISNGSAAYPETDINSLSASNPARKNPSWAVKYQGKLWYNPGIPEVRQLITDGVIEIIERYEVDGIHFDDYFYPYPDGGAKFDDGDAFAKYGGGYKILDDFRRASVNTLVQMVYDGIKKVNPNVRFGISPFGIWANQSDKTPTGSATRGFESYYSLYSDAKAWINGGYIDYICPQIYWSFDTSVARYDVLVRWWSAAVDGTGVDLYIGHAAHKAPDWSELEIPRQIEYARAYMGVAGGIFYGYKDIASNSNNLKENLAKLYAEPRRISASKDNGKGITVGRPGISGSAVTGGAVNIMAGSNPLFPVYYKGEKVTRTKSGFFSIYVALKDGKNEIVLTQNNSNLNYVVTKGKTSVNPEYTQTSSYGISVISYKIGDNTLAGDTVTLPGNKIAVRVYAPSKSTVTAKLGGAAINLEPLNEPPDEGTYMTEVYAGTITLPNIQPKGEIIDLGNIVFTAERGNETASFTGINIKLTNESVYKPYGACEVIKDYTPFKTGINSDSYDDYLYASVGMRDNIVEFIDFKEGYYKLGCGGYVPASNVVLLPGKTLLVNRILSTAMENTGSVTEIRFAVTENVPINAKCKDGVFNVTLFNTPDGGRNLAFDLDNPIFKNAWHTQDKAKKTVTYTINLTHPDNFYGFEVVYEAGFIVIKVKNPMKKIEGNLPLAGLTVVIDPGHGGTDPGSIGFLGSKGKNEKDLNLEISLALRPKLIELGATVVMTRDKDDSISIAGRMEILNKINPDFMVSVHHNSMPDGQDNSLIRGFLPLYCNDAGRLLAKSAGTVIASELNRYERDARYQAVGVLRNYKFPSALFEMSFMTNPDEHEFANSAEAVQRSADGIAKGIIAWIDSQQKWVK